MSMEYFKDALREWWKSMWPQLQAFQKRYVDDGHKDDGSFPGYADLTKYEWLVVNQTIEGNERLRALFITGVRTNMGGTSPNCATQIAQEFFQQAYRRITRGKLLIGDPDIVFDEIYRVIEPFAVRTDSLQYVAQISLLNVRVESAIELDARTTLRQMSATEKDDIAWKDAVWDDQWETCAIIEHVFDDQFLGAGAVNASRDEEFIALGREMLLALSALRPPRATLGKMVIRPHGWSPAQFSSSRLLDYPFGTERIRITNAEAEIIRDAWNALRNRRDRRVRIAAEYLADPRRMADPEKGLIDVVTALEALVGNDKQRRLVRRLSLYAARLVASDLGLSEREVYDDLVRAFSRREVALRGQEPSQEEKDGDGALVRAVSAVARRLLVMRMRSDSKLRDDQIDVLLRSPAASPRTL
ncbi:MAG: hypothetical protein EPN49_16200 [Rhodanobacter sp.]|nr:MAG: hypothetical protein EPN49_16200 [Rhodanobacter sp.]